MTRFKRWGWMVLILSGARAAWGAPAGSSMPEIFYAANEDSFYQQQYRDLLKETQWLLPAAIKTVLQSKRLARGLGIQSDYLFQNPIRVEIKVIPEDSLYHGLEGTAGWKKVDGRWTHMLTLNIAAYIQNPKEDIPQLLCHEMAHILLADVLGMQAAETVPMWLNEGLAQSVTHEGRSRLRDLALSLEGEPSMLIPCQLEAPIDAFAHGEGNFQCYPEYYLAVERLAQIGGAQAIGKVLLDLRGGHKTSAVFLSATGKDYALFQKDVDAYLANIVAGRANLP